MEHGLCIFPRRMPHPRKPAPTDKLLGLHCLLVSFSYDWQTPSRPKIYANYLHPIDIIGDGRSWATGYGLYMFPRRMSIHENPRRPTSYFKLDCIVSSFSYDWQTPSLFSHGMKGKSPVSIPRIAPNQEYNGASQHDPML